MKYIRTKDGRFIKILKEGIDEFGKYGMVNEEDCIRNYADLKQANTIDELFDEFVITCKDRKGDYFLHQVCERHAWFEIEKIDVFKKEFQRIKTKCESEEYLEINHLHEWERYDELYQYYGFYGAIWTDKGLIYKAKMKGILPNGDIDWELL